MATSPLEQIAEEAAQLSTDDQRRVAEYIHQLLISRDKTSPQNLLRFAGSIPHEDLEAMCKAIEEEFEQIDADEW